MFHLIDSFNICFFHGNAYCFLQLCQLSVKCQLIKLYNALNKYLQINDIKSVIFLENFMKLKKNIMHMRCQFVEKKFSVSKKYYNSNKINFFE